MFKTHHWLVSSSVDEVVLSWHRRLVYRAKNGKRANFYVGPAKAPLVFDCDFLPDCIAPGFSSNLVIAIKWIRAFKSAIQLINEHWKVVNPITKTRIQNHQNGMEGDRLGEGVSHFIVVVSNWVCDKRAWVIGCFLEIVANKRLPIVSIAPRAKVLAQIQSWHIAIWYTTQYDLLAIVWIARTSDPAKFCQQVWGLVESHLF